MTGTGQNGSSPSRMRTPRIDVKDKVKEDIP